MHDSLGFCESIVGDEKEAYADKAYDSKELREELKKNGIKPRLMYRLRDSDPHRALKAQVNKGISKVRCQVEKIFGALKRTYGWKRARYLGLEKNQVWLHILAMAYNLKRSLTLKNLPPVPSF